MAHKCGFAIAAQRRAQKRKQHVLMFLYEAGRLYRKDRLDGYSGTRKEWKTRENLKRVTEIFGYCPLYAKDLKQWKGE